MSLPDTDGVLISTGNPQDISTLGTLDRPILAYSSAGRMTRLENGVPWVIFNVSTDVMDLQAGLGFGSSYCFVPREICFRLCTDMKRFSDSVNASCREYSCALPLDASAFSNCSGLEGKPGGENKMPDALIIQGPFSSENSSWANSLHLDRFLLVVGRRSNKIHVPSSQDGILLSTFSLSDVKSSSSRMTSLAIDALRVGHPQTALQLGRWLTFGHLESGWCYESAETRRDSDIFYPGPAFDLVMTAEDVHPPADLKMTSAASARVLSKVEIYTLHEKLNDKLILRAFEKAGLPGNQMITAQSLLNSGESPEEEARVRSTLQRVFKDEKLSVEESMKVSTALLRRAHAALLRLNPDEVGRFQSLNHLNKALLKFGQSRYSSGIRLLPDGKDRTGKLAFNLSSEVLPNGKRAIFAMEKFIQHTRSGAHQYYDSEHSQYGISHLHIRGVDGIMISSANIHDISVGAGTMTSLRVKDESEFNQSVIIGHGEKGKAQLHLHEQTISICDGVLMPPENSPSSSPQSATRSETKEPGTCYKKFDKGRQWSDAQSICKGWGGYLAILDSEARIDFVDKYVVRTPCTHGTSWEAKQGQCGHPPTADAWVGLTNFEYPTMWMWQRPDDPLDPQQPKDYRSNTSYVQGVRQQKDNARRCAAIARKMQRDIPRRWVWREDSTLRLQPCADQCGK